MRKKFCCLPFFLVATQAFCAYPAATTANLSYLLGYESYKLPDGQRNLGVVDLTILDHFNSLFYGGLQLDSAVRGESGGFFSLGLNGGLQYPLAGALTGRIGAVVGGGGGGHDISQTVGGGLFYQPYVGLDYHFSQAAVGLQYSYIRFPNGRIASSQVGVQVSGPFNVSYADFALRNQSLNNEASTASDSLYFGVLDSEIFPNKGMRNTRDALADSRFNMIGFEMGKYATQEIYYFLRVLGEVHGMSNGFAGAFGGIGYQLPVLYKTDLFVDMALGSAGGGSVNTGGGFVYMPSLGVRYHVTSDVAVSASGSLFNATKGDFKTKAFTVGLRYSFHNVNDVQPAQGSQLEYQGWQFKLFNQTYFKPTATTQQTLPNMQLLAAQVNFYATSYVYLAAQTAFAYHGQNVGGYFTAMFGPGVSSFLDDARRFNVYAQALIGAAGGGGLDISDGAMVQPELGLDYRLTQYCGLQLGVGRLIALKGKFNSTVLSVGIDTSFSTLSG